MTRPICLLLLVGLSLGACGARPVRCDGHLQPINTPAPVLPGTKP
jgi:hypothetical protein